MRFGQRIAAFARAHVGCSAHHNVDVYREAVVPKADRGTPKERAYFEANPAPSTCALFYTQCLAAGEASAAADGIAVERDVVADASYAIGSAVANVENIGAKHRAIEWYGPGEHPTEPFAEGDVPIINGPPYGVHVIVVTSDAEDLTPANDNGSAPPANDNAIRWHTTTAEGGQADGGVQAFEHVWEVRKDGSMYPGPTSQRRVIAVVRARRFQYDGDAPANDNADEQLRELAELAIAEGTDLICRNDGEDDGSNEEK